ncbi:MAG: 5-(carboxyamino)imidazole ribonucleotide mutase [Cyclobacteriaceae bacterium]|nr:5-(carboxyamino)imidazole ribonucleotide mutase [Cyclobacteriaceae bacterium]
MDNPLVYIVMGSKSDLPVMKAAAEILEEFGIPFDLSIMSAHRTPYKMIECAENARARGVKAIIAGAGGAAHLPGVFAAFTTLPVIGVPIKSSISIDGWDSILSILQMPGGIPVATVALDGAKNAGLLAVRIIAAFDKNIEQKLAEFHRKMGENVEKTDKEVKEKGYKNV